MRRLVFPILAALGLIVVGPGSAFAAPTPGAGATSAPPKKICKITDPRLDELSGLVSTPGGFATVDDSTDNPSHKRIFYINDGCKVTNSVSYPGGGPRDSEAMAVSADGQDLWIGDIGDNDRSRHTIAFWKLDVAGKKQPVLFRAHYPDGAHDAEAMIIDGSGRPVVITKDPSTAGIYAPTGELRPDTTDGVALQRVGQITLPTTSTTDNPLGPIGRIVVTDATVSPDRSKVAIRTYADAFEWPVKNGDVVGAFSGAPVATPLPNEPQGESLAYGSDGKEFFTVSDMQGQHDVENDLLRYVPAVASSPVVAKAPAGGSAKSASWFSSLSLTDVTWLVIGVGIIGAILVGIGISGIVRHRRRTAYDDPHGFQDPDGYGNSHASPATELMAVGSPQRPPVYGRPSGGQPSGNPPPGVYGGARGPADRRPSGSAVPPAPPHGGGPGVYGGGPAGGRPPAGGQPQTYGRPPQSPGQPGGDRPARGAAVPPPAPGRYGSPTPPPSPDEHGSRPQRPAGFFGAPPPDDRPPGDDGPHTYGRPAGR